MSGSLDSEPIFNIRRSDVMQVAVTNVDRSEAE